MSGPLAVVGPVETHCSYCGHEWTQHHTGYDTRARDDGPSVCYAFEPKTHGTCGCRATPEKSYYRALQTEREMHAAWRKRAEEAEAELARGRAVAPAGASRDPPCALFSPSETDADCCKHCGWTEASHEGIAARDSLIEIQRAQIRQLSAELERVRAAAPQDAPQEGPG